MSADNKKQELRSLLAGKNTAELEELLALEATEFDAAGPDVDYIAAILEVIAERESEENRNNDMEMTETAWEDFQEYYSLKKQEELETDTDGETPRDHRRKTEYGQKPRKISRVLRYAVIAAAVVVLLCGTALGWNFFQAIADWTEETFYFLTGQEKEETFGSDPFVSLRSIVESKTDTAVVPTWAPVGTEENGSPKKTDRENRTVVLASFLSGKREFTIQIIVHDTPPEAYIGTYQKDATIEEEYTVGGISHYIVGNNETLSTMWINGCVEGHIQGELTLEEMRQMIDSIYEL